jgi:hypothetical protein
MGRPASPPPSERASARSELAERRRAALKLATVGWSYDKIFREGGLGHTSRQAVYRDIKAAYKQALRDQTEAVEEHRAAELALIDQALVVAHRIMNTQHLAHNGGRIVQREVERPDGSTELVDVIDHGPNLAAAEKLIRFGESRRRLLGTDAPAKVEQQVDSTISYVVQVAPEELEQL